MARSRANGVYLLRERRIVLRSTLSDDGRAKTLAHELAHHLLHRDAEANEADRSTFEAEAEGTAYAVLSYFGVDASEHSFAYVARWAGSREAVSAALANIQKAVRAVIDAVEEGAPRAEPTTGTWRRGRRVPSAVAARGTLMNRKTGLSASAPRATAEGYRRGLPPRATGRT